MDYMRSWVLATACAVCLAVSPANASETVLTINKLVQLIQSCTAPEAKGKYPDKVLADYIKTIKLNERLDDRTLEEIEAMDIGVYTRHALEALRDRSKTLTAAPPPAALLPPKEIPPPSSEEQAAILDEVRDYALNFSSNLPDFLCTQLTKRYGAPKPGTKYGGSAKDDPRWQLFDELTMRLSYFNQKEDYHLILHNNTPTAADYKSVGGSSSYGDFGSMLKLIFDRTSQARFEWDHWGTLRTKRVMAFAYHIEQGRSQYHLQVPDEHLDYVTAYRGLVEVDKETHKIMRITVEAEDIPVNYPIKAAKTILDYDYTDISGRTFLLPLKGQVFMTSADMVTRNDESFHSYRKYSADSEITFDDAQIPPDVPAAKTEETVDPGQKPPAKTSDTTKKNQ
jgi:hypothetical protein